MLTLISPAKSLDYDTPIIDKNYSEPDFLDHAQILVDYLKKFSIQDIRALMKVSENIAQLNAKRFVDWNTPFTFRNAKQALFVFRGDVYQGIDVNTLSDIEIKFSQDHIRILSGLYGLLRPLDLMQAYRLEMGTALKKSFGKDLYEFWQLKVTNEINKILGSKKVLVNLASQEYFKVVNTKKITSKIITPIFKDWKKDQFKIVSFYAKKARGLMCRYICKEKIENVDNLKNFDYEGYHYNEKLSSDLSWIFTRRIN